jgi:hypothetical protein
MPATCTDTCIKLSEWLRTHSHASFTVLPFLIDIKCGHVSKQDGIHNKTKYKYILLFVCIFKNNLAKYY